MGYHIEKDIIPGLPNIPLKATKIVVAHESGNPNNTGKDALDNEISFMKRNWRNAFVSHWVGGGGRIVQLAPTGRMQYGAGYYANQISYAHVELARTDDPEQFKKDYAAYVWLLRHLAQEAGIPITLDSSSDRGIKTHKWVTNNLGGTTHVDPYGYLAKFGVSAEQFKKDIEGGEAPEKPSTSKPVKNTVTVKRSATHYATGERIADFVKGSSYKVIQEKSDRVLLSPINSWVKKSDIEEYSSSGGSGGKVTVKESAKTYATGERIADFVKGKSYEVIQEKSDRVLLSPIMSWVRKSDIKEYGGSSKKPTSKPDINGKVVLKNSASRYATGESIPDRYKGKTYTVMQEKPDRVLLKELYSWVRKSDVVPAGNVKKRDYRVGDKVKISSNAKTYATGESIPSWVKGKTYTIQQVKSDRVLLKEIYSWVRKSDLR